MALALFLGFVLGFFGSVAAAGPLAVVIVSAGLAGRSRRVAMLAIGGAIAEGLWALAAASGLGWVLSASPTIEHAVRVGAPLLAIVVGAALVLMAPREVAAAPKERSASSLATGFLLVALNPSFFVSWVASCGLIQQHPDLAPAVTPRGAPALAAGALIGVVVWYTTLGGLLARHRERIAPWQRGVVRAMGAALIAGGLIALVRGL